MILTLVNYDMQKMVFGFTNSKWTSWTIHNVVIYHDPLPTVSTGAIL